LADHATGEGWLAEIKGDHRGPWSLAVVDRVTGEPANRLHEALKQSQRRQQERLHESTQPIQIRSLAGTAPRTVALAHRDRDIGAPATSRTTSTPRCTRSPGTPRTATAKAAWIRLYRFGGTIGTLWTDDAQALVFIPEPGASVALLVNSMRSACALGTPTSWVFDDHAAWSGQDHWAGRWSGVTWPPWI
jgi:hypothetical protein